MVTHSPPGKDKYGFGFGGTGKKSFSSQFDSYGEVDHIACHVGVVYSPSPSPPLPLTLPQAYGKNDTIGCYLNLNNGSIAYSINGISPSLPSPPFLPLLSFPSLPLPLFLPSSSYHILAFLFTGNFFGKAFDIPKHLHGETFFAAVVLKVYMLVHPHTPIPEVRTRLADPTEC